MCNVPFLSKTDYVTRLDCVKAAVHAQITELAKTSPDTVVTIVSFGSSISVLADAGRLLDVERRLENDPDVSSKFILSLNHDVIRVK